MTIELKEINYKTIEVPDDTTFEDVERMVNLGQVIIADTNEADYFVKFPDKQWESI